MTARSVGAEERRARLGRRHALAERVTTPEAAADAVVVLHATDPATLFLSTIARLVTPSIAQIEDALYVRRTMVRTLAMRRTLFVATRDVLGVVEASSTAAVAAAERKRLEDALADAGIADPPAWIAAAADEIAAAITADGAQARELTARVPRLATRIVLGRGTKYPLEAGATSRTIGVLANDGVLVRGRPAGNWTGRMYEWHLRSSWLGAEPPAPAEADAKAELVRRWLGAFAPGTMTDLRWWTRWRVREIQAALDTVGAVEVDLDEGSGWMLPDDLDPVTPPDPWVALLPSLDPTPMGWKDRAWYVGGHDAPLFDRNGNIGPTVWADGRIVGGWAQRADGEIVSQLLEDVGADHRRLLEIEIDRLAACIGDVVVKPSFPTPLQIRLSDS